MNDFKYIINNIKNKKFAIATSGGADSMALCHLCKAEGLSPLSIIVDHKYRKTSSQEAKNVKTELTKHKIDCVILENARPIPSSNIEKFLREARYDLITEYCKNNGIDIVLTAHHRDDNVETFLMRLERGASVDGLCGINQEVHINGIKFIRPLLSTSKKELVNYLKENNLKWFEDESNLDTQFTRNKIRHALKEISGDETFDLRITNVINSFNRLSDYLLTELTKAKKEVFLDEYSIDKEKFLNLHEEIALRILRDFFLDQYTDKNKFRFEKIERLYKFIKENTGKTQLSGISIKVNENKIIFLKT